MIVRVVNSFSGESTLYDNVLSVEIFELSFVIHFLYKSPDLTFSHSLYSIDSLYLDE